METTKLSMLYVEDDAGNRETVAAMLARRLPHMTLHQAQNGREGLKLFEQHLPDLVLTDIRMPVMDGLEMAREIKALRANTKIIVTTAHSDLDYLMDSIDIGISQYVLKPIETARLFRAIGRCVDIIKMERQIEVQNDHIRKLSRAVEQSSSIVLITDISGAIEYVNPMFSEVTGYSAQEVAGSAPDFLLGGEHAQESYQDILAALRAGDPWRGELVGLKKNNDSFWQVVSISPVRNSLGTVTNFVVVTEDITRLKEAEQEICRLNNELQLQVQEGQEKLAETSRELAECMDTHTGA